MKLSKFKINIELDPSSRPHQRNCQESLWIIESDGSLTPKSGINVLPTGTGKTRIQAERIRIEIENIEIVNNIIRNSESVKENLPVVTIVYVPTLLLCMQQFEEISSYLIIKYRINARYVFFNSGKVDDTSFTKKIRQSGLTYNKVVCTTSVKELNNVYDDCCKDGRPLIIITTYKSGKKCGKCKFVPNTSIFDEAHHVTGAKYSKLLDIPSGCKLFFTATPKNDKEYITDGRGMNNKKKFGPVLYKEPPRALVEAGEMVGINLMDITPVGNYKPDEIDGDPHVLINILAQVQEANQEYFNESNVNSGYSGKLGCKQLISVTGSEQLNLLKSSRGRKFIEKKLRDDPTLHIAAIGSKFGILMDGTYIKGPISSAKRLDFFNFLRNLPLSHKLLLYHINILSEGIDVPGITSITLLRNCDDRTLNQTVGRGTRLLPIDRNRLYAGEISVKDKENGMYVKPSLIFNLIRFQKDQKVVNDAYLNVLDRWNTDYNFDPDKDYIIYENAKGIYTENEEESENTNRKTSNSKLANVKCEKCELQQNAIVSKRRKKYADENDPKMKELITKHRSKQEKNSES